MAGLPIRVGNDLRNLSRGVELVARFQPVGSVRATVSYAFLDHDLEVTPGVIDAQGGRGDLADPRHQLQVHGRFDLPRSLEADLYVRRIGELPAPGAPPWTDVTARFGWRPRTDVEVSLVGRDLANATHREFANPAGGVFLLRRAVFVRASVLY
jgi:iron complex outermembrane receptor protein